MSIDHTPAASTDTEPSTVEIPLSFDVTPRFDFDDIDGLDDVCDQLHTAVTSLVADTDIKTHSVLVHGPHGNGKTRVADALAGELAAEGFNVGWISDLDEYSCEDDDAVGQAVREAVAAAPSVLVLDQLSAVRTGSVLPRLREELARVAAADEKVLVVATTTPGMLGGDVPTCFEMNIALEQPDESRIPTLVDRYVDEFSSGSDADVDIDTHDEALCEVAVGLSAAELHLGTKRAFQEVGVASDSNDPATVTTDVLRESLTTVDENRPAPTSFHSRTSQKSEERFVEETDVSFDDIGGLDDVKAELRGAVEFPVEFNDVYESCGLSSPGILLHGAPGNGKTMLAKALANEYDRTFVAVNGPELRNKYVGQTEANIREVFETAREEAPSILFFDEIDTLAATRQNARSYEVSFANTLLTELDGFRDTADVLVVATTNRPDALDKAVLREGRLGRHVHVPTPDRDGIHAVVAAHTDGFPLADDVTTDWIARALPDGVTAATVTGVCDQALRWHAMRRATESDATDLEVTREDVRAAIEEYPMPSTDTSSHSGGSGFY